MLTLDYLRNRLNGKIEAIYKTTEQVIESAGGYDGIVALVQTKAISPMIILENSEIGEFSFEQGGFLRSSQSIWVMQMVPKDGDRQKAQQECFKMMIRILSILSVHDENDVCLKEWGWNRIPWAVRNAGANYTGYEFTLYFEENTDLEYHG